MIYVCVCSDKSVYVTEDRSVAERWSHYSGNAVVSEVSHTKGCCGVFTRFTDTVKLNDEYTAEIVDDTVIVGCQRFAKEKVRELFNKCFPQH